MLHLPSALGGGSGGVLPSHQATKGNLSGGYLGSLGELKMCLLWRKDYALSTLQKDTQRDRSGSVVHSIFFTADKTKLYNQYLLRV